MPSISDAVRVLPSPNGTLSCSQHVFVRAKYAENAVYECMGISVYE